MTTPDPKAMREIRAWQAARQASASPPAPRRRWRTPAGGWQIGRCFLTTYWRMCWTDATNGHWGWLRPRVWHWRPDPPIRLSTRDLGRRYARGHAWEIVWLGIFIAWRR